ncbi:hypothetical protein GALMADRAFT_258267 [Galerina marginata CBS 339.88]|uniref:Uncharacterized protein n=1 Tax=Galerina marginata (strain CBS 339.88) TaxID=685588 RepID=A0A067SLE2_GALM3|nr:hypothetical protein GALMADRAFT_258267 [Galerina marginata CBS 339.88]
MVNALTIKDIDRITRRLPSGHIISIALRLRPTPDISTFNYRIAITFTPHIFPSPRLANPILVSPHTMHAISPLPQLTIYLAYRYRPRPRARFATPPFYPKSNWLMNQPYDDALTLTWMPTEQDSSAFLGFSTKSRKLKFPLLVFHVVDSDIAVEFVEVPLNLRDSDWDTVLPSYLGGMDTTRNLYRSSDFPKDVEVDGDTMQIKLRRKTLLEETGHQMLVTFDANTASERISQVQEMDEEEEEEQQQQQQQQEEEEEEEEGVKMTVMLGVVKRSSARA